ncbi:MAG: malate synthase G [Paracoccaceae bacterium]|uniref:malate synthase G n=1 Tax=Candidatus Salinivivens marinus TaxID=3381703 RepID=UPI000BE0AF0E|nr:MAG: malate synthase G [Rhodobacteraceae bacterium MED-G08]|tara:strand:+ start:3471 stop:5612 length:2142 start_codon:yes stop_codon:yes gene_type:complete
MKKRLMRCDLSVEEGLVDFIENTALPDTGVSQNNFWLGLSSLIKEMTPENRKLLRVREELQDKIDKWHVARIGQPHDHVAYKSYLKEIGYLVDEGENFLIETENVDPEISSVAGPQLVVPSTNARYALNAANARWGSLYDSLYGTDAMGAFDQAKVYDRGRGARVVARARVFLDNAFPIIGASHADVKRYYVSERQLLVDDLPLVSPEKFIGYSGNSKAPNSILLKNNGLFVVLVFNRAHVVGSRDQAGLADVRIESALSAIIDLEDSVACVDGEDKVNAYSTWLGLMKGDLTSEFEKNGKKVVRRLNSDLSFISPSGDDFSIRARALLWIRNVGHLMTTPAVLDSNGDEIFEGLLDAMVTTMLGMHDLKKADGNSRHGSIYIVKPKMHGPAEVDFADKIFSKVESFLGIEKYSVKLGIMDEERRTSVNLKECIRAAKRRVAFINTGFLDRTGDEIHTSMEAGPFSRKDFIKRKSWIVGYENQNVDIGLECGLSGRAQIGKGMWAMPDLMSAMLEQKIEHPKSGANCAWVPSPTAATLHALHYHQVDVFAVQENLRKNGRRAYVDTLLDIPLAAYRKWSHGQKIREVENNAQGILGYVVRWVDQGIGCSKVPDINNVGLMEDRATCRISSQALANWLHHNVVSEEEVITALKSMAKIVDEQNINDPNYIPMSPSFDGLAFKAAYNLIFEGKNQPSGYTEPILHETRLKLKNLA